VEKEPRKDWNCSHGKAKNVWQYLANHNETFNTAIMLEFDGEEFELDIFHILRVAVELIDTGQSNSAAGLLEATAQILWEGENPLTYSMTELPEHEIDREVEKFSMTLDERLRKIVEDGQRGNGEDN